MQGCFHCFLWNGHRTRVSEELSFYALLGRELASYTPAVGSKVTCHAVRVGIGLLVSVGIVQICLPLFLGSLVCTGLNVMWLGPVLCPKLAW